MPTLGFRHIQDTGITDLSNVYQHLSSNEIFLLNHFSDQHGTFFHCFKSKHLTIYVWEECNNFQDLYIYHNIYNLYIVYIIYIYIYIYNWLFYSLLYAYKLSNLLLPNHINLQFTHFFPRISEHFEITNNFTFC